MNICLVNDVKYGSGAAIAAWRLAQGLADAGHRIAYIYLYDRPSPEPRGFVTRCLEQNRGYLARKSRRALFRLGEKASPGSAKGNRFLATAYASNGKRLLGMLDEFQPAVVSVHNIPLMIGHDEVVRIAREYPVVWTMHDCHAICLYAYRFRLPDGGLRTEPAIRYAPDENAARRLLEAQVPITFVTPSEWLRQAMLPEAGGHKELVTINNGLSREDFHPAEGPEYSGPLRVLAVASELAYPRKNIAAVLEAVEKLPAGVVELSLLGRESAEIRRRAPSARFLGHLLNPEELRDVYTDADIHVLPSLIDNLPNTALESLFCGTPVLGAETGGIPEMIEEGTSGWLFDPADSAGLAARLEHIASNRKELDSMQNRCAEWATERFSVEKQTLAYVQLFERMLKAQKGKMQP